eukprot:CAMPEP_0176488058 /NCGR_PEP_ID=MMETSP0200_2-20121128/6492_1 /TAXON_ID=947934 /ORGANISM="Chaetoceros sp., Strain GSL56" /LENGTH=384 /DNA_ID=CAMNT_0017884987 /DNA_START=80 /DNA_END=1234 /DNA_ORIENTATION=+
MTSRTPEELKAIYREKAVMFLMANQTSMASSSSSSSSSSTSPYGATAMAKSLVIRSLYDTELPTNRDSQFQFHSGLPRTHVVNVQVQNMIRSGAHNAPVPFEEMDQLVINGANGGEKRFVGSSDTMNANHSNVQLLQSCQDFYCKCCGISLLPIPVPAAENNETDGQSTGVLVTAMFTSQIQLKRAKRGNTRRRRASRYTAKKHVYDTNILQKHKGGGRSFAQRCQIKGHSHSSHGEVVASYSRTQAALKSIAVTRRIGDGMCKNYIRYKCQCGHVISVKGIKASYNRDASRLDHQQQQQQQPLYSKVKTIRKPEDNCNEDFIQLCASPSSKPSKSVNKPANKIMNVVKQLNPPLSKKGRQSKRKSSASTKKSKLQDFLSSLND